MTNPLRWTMMATQVPAGGSLGGVVRYTTELTRALAERDDVIVSAVTTRSAADTVGELVGAAGRIYTVPDLPTAALSLAERYLRLPAWHDGADVVQGVKHLLPMRSDALRVLTVHDMLLLDRSQDFGAAKRLLLPRPYRSSIADADLLLCVSAATRDRLAALVPGAQDRADVVHLATSSSLRSATPQPIDALHGRRFALAVGDPTPRKNLRTIVTAWAAVWARHPGVALAIAGPPSWGRTVLGAMYQRLVDLGAIVSLGQVSDAELRWAYEHADVVLCPSLAEGFGLPAAEALDLGAPVLISDDPAMREVCAGRERAALPALNVDAWVAEISDALAGPRRTVADAAARTWADVADDTVRSVRAALAARDGVSPRQPTALRSA